MASDVFEERVLIAANNVSFNYDEASPVLVDVTLPIHRGDFLAIIGPNGSGKTTLVKILLGLLKPSRGGVVLMGKEISRFKDWHRISYIPQKASHIDPIFPATVREVVSMALFSLRGTLSLSKRQANEAVCEAIRQVDMERLIQSPIGALSGGQQQRVFIARALVSRPEVMFLDEPTTGVDTATQDRFYGLLDTLNKRDGLTIVLITHDIGIVNKHITQVACLNQKLVYHGSHDDFCRSRTLQDMLSGGHHLVSHEH